MDSMVCESLKPSVSGENSVIKAKALDTNEELVIQTIQN